MSIEMKTTSWLNRKVELAFGLAILTLLVVNAFSRHLGQTSTVLIFGTVLGLFIAAGIGWIARPDTSRVGLTEAALRASEDKYQMLLDGIKDYAIFMLDIQGRVVTWNAGAERIKGYTAQEIIGHNFSCFFLPEEIKQGRPEELLRTTAARGRLEDQGMRVRKDGSRFLANLTLTAIRDSAGTLQGFSEFSHDLKESKESGAKYRGLLEAAPDAMVVVNQEGEIVLLNLQAEKQFGYHRDELIGQKVNDIIPSGFAERLIADSTRSAADATAQHIGMGIELKGRRKDGTEFPIEIMLSPLKSAEGVLVTAAIRDISTRIRAEEELKRSNYLLTESNRELEAFNYTAAHDLRAPLRHMHGFASLLHQSWYRKLDDDGRHCLDKISSSSKQMGLLLDNLLKFSRLGRVDLQESGVNLGRLVVRIQHELEPESKDRALTWVIGDLPDVEGDEALLHQVLFNLISNAVKYTSKCEHARIEIGSHCGNGNNITVFVRDNGAGFEMDYVNKLFHVFQRLHKSRDFEGTGIGLAIVRRIVERHGGRVWAEGILGQGATFYFSLHDEGTKQEVKL
jgi:PAS domain S-box-containing protein